MAPMITPKVGLDLGTTKAVMWAGKGVRFHEPNLLVVDPHKNRVLFYGKAAAERREQLKSGAELLRPVRRGTIADYAATVFLIKKMLARSIKIRVIKPLILAATPIQLSSVETRALCDAARAAGAGGIFLVPCNLASLWSLPDTLQDPTGSLVVDIGASVTDVSVIASNQILVGRTIPIGGDDITALTRRVMEISYGVRMGWSEAGQVKVDVGVNYYEDEVIEKHRGESDHSGGFRKVNIPKRQVAEFLLQGVEPLFSGIIATLEETPPELFEDIFHKGLILTGGSAMLPGIRRRLQDRLNINVNRLPEPSLSIIRGLGHVTANFNKYQDFFERHMEM